MSDRPACETCQAFSREDITGGSCNLNPASHPVGMDCWCMQHKPNEVIEVEKSEFCTTCLAEKPCPKHTVGHVPIEAECEHGTVVKLTPGDGGIFADHPNPTHAKMNSDPFPDRIDGSPEEKLRQAEIKYDVLSQQTTHAWNRLKELEKDLRNSKEG